MPPLEALDAEIGRALLADDVLASAIASLDKGRARRRVRILRAVAEEIADPFELDDRMGAGAFSDLLLIIGKPEDEAVTLIEAKLAPPVKGLMNYLEGSVEEVDAHNRKIRERAERDRKPTFIGAPHSTPPVLARPRQRGASCSSRVRGSRRVSRSCSRGGDSGDNSDPDGPGEAGAAPNSGGSR